MANKKAITFLSRSAPYGGHNGQLCLEMALACAVFEQQVSYVFLDDGVYQLLKAQDANSINRKTLGKALATLDLYGIEQVLVDGDSLRSRGLSGDDLLLNATLVSRSEIGQLLADADVVFNL